MSSEQTAPSAPVDAVVMRGDDAQVGEWWSAEKDGFRVQWSPRELWLQCGQSSVVIAEWPTYGDVRRAIRGLGFPLPSHWSA